MTSTTIQTENSNFGIFALIVTVLGMPVYGFQFAVVNPLSPVFNKMFNETYQNRYNETLPPSTWITLLSLTSSSINIGATVGAIFVGRLLMYMSRKRLLQANHVLSLVGIFMFTLFGKLTSSYEAIIVGRTVIGITVGVGFIIVPTIIAEMCTRVRQSVWLSVSSSSVALGVLMGGVATHPKVLGTEELWPIASALVAILNVIYLSVSWKIPNTLYYIARQGDKDKTIAALNQLRIGDQEELEKEYNQIVEEIKGKKIIRLTEIFRTKQYRMQFFNVLCLYTNIPLCGMTVIVLYSDRIFRQVGVADDLVTFLTIGLFAGRFFASLCGMKLVERFGGKKVLLIAAVVEICSLVLFIISQAITHLAPVSMPYVSASVIAVFSVCFSGGTFAATPPLAAAITIEPTRSTILGLAVVIFWILSWFAGFIDPYLEVAIGPYSFAVWLVFTILCLVYFIIFLPETKGRSIEQIQAKLLYRRFSSTNLSELQNKRQAIPMPIA